MTVALYHSMDKVLPQECPTYALGQVSMLKNERFQCLVYVETSQKQNCKINVEGLGDAQVLFRRVKEVEVKYAVSQNRDDYVLSGEAGAYYDLLEDCSPSLSLTDEKPNVFLLSVCGDKTPLTAGEKEIFVKVEGVESAVASFSLTVVNCHLLPMDVFVTNWVHYDCISRVHNVELFSDGFYAVFERYLENYVAHGNNMLLTPLFTPPLDTEVGSERMTAQLVLVAYDGEKYSFDFTQLEYFLRFVLARGIEYIEFSHLLTQWGAKFCPKILVQEGGERIQKFGWHTPCNGEEYKNFLRSFLPALMDFLEGMGVKEKCYFHLSDEPPEDCIDNYEEISRLVTPLLQGCKIMDALSSFEFEKRKLTGVNVVAINDVTPFLENGVSHAVYNCCLPANGYYTNRFICFPSQRMRVLGILMYHNNAQGYLHWGYNFYNAYLSKGAIDPYETVDVNGVYPAGDAFIVYPVEGGCVDAIRHETFLESMQDFRALKTLESLTDREYVLSLLAGSELSGYNGYPRDMVWLSDLREKVNREIMKRSV